MKRPTVTYPTLALLLVGAQVGSQVDAQVARGEQPIAPGFVDVAAQVPDLAVDLRYFGANNFIGERIDGYERARCLLSAPAAAALAAVQRDLAQRGLGLKAFDCYRPQRAVAHF